MDVLESLTGILIDVVRTVKFEEGKIGFIREHIKNAANENFPVLQFPRGQDWLNVPTPLTESDLKGKVVVLDFFTFCCINCHHILPYLKELEEKFPVSDGLVIVGVHSGKFDHEKSSENVDLALKKLNITHPVINDTNNYMWNRMKVICWPSIIIIGPNGKALFSLPGEQKKDELFLFVEATLNFYAGELSPHPLPICADDVSTANILKFPAKIARYGNTFAVSDAGNDRILVFDHTGLILHKIGGRAKGYRNGSFEEAQFNSPQGLAFYNDSKIYVADTENHAVRLIDLTKYEVFTVVGTGIQGSNTTGGKLGTIQEISSPWDLCFVSADHVQVSCNNVGLLPPNYAGFLCQASCSHVPPPPPAAFFQASGSHVPPPPPATFCLPPGYENLPGPSSQSAFEEDVAEETEDDTDKNVLLIAMSGTHQIWAYFLQDTIWWKGKKYRRNVCTAIAGSGWEENRNNTYPMLAAFAQPSGIVYSENHNCVFIADSESSSIRKLSLEDGAVSHVVGGDRNPVNLFHFGDVDGFGYDAKLQHPLAITYSKRENALYVCDTYNNRLKQVNLATTECTSIHRVDGLFKEPSGCVLNEEEDVLFVVDTNNHRIVTYDLQSRALNIFEIREPEPERPVHTAELQWELETEVNKMGGLLVLAIHLGPESITGNWRIDLTNSNIETRDLNGTVSCRELKLEMKLLPNIAGVLETATIHFNLRFCYENACYAKNCNLTLYIMRSENGPEFQEMEFNQFLLP